MEDPDDCVLRAVLLDRDGTLVEDVPYNGDPHQVRLLPQVREAIWECRSLGLALGVVTNQSGIARGLISFDDALDVNAEVDRLLGAFDAWAMCPHAPWDECPCRKPLPGMIFQVAADLGVEPEQCLVVGDRHTDVAAGEAAGARAALVPPGVTLLQVLMEQRIGASLGSTDR